jgi:hypothetical protein
LVDPIDGVRPIDSKWVFKKRQIMIKIFTSIRHDWWQKGFKQIHDIDYDKTFSQVVMLKSVQIFLPITTYFDYEI